MSDMKNTETYIDRICSEPDQAIPNGEESERLKELRSEADFSSLDDRKTRTFILEVAWLDDRDDVQAHIRLKRLLQNENIDQELNPDAYPGDHLDAVSKLLQEYDWGDLEDSSFQLILKHLIDDVPFALKNKDIVSEVVKQFDLRNTGITPDNNTISIGSRVAEEFPRAFVFDRNGRGLEGAIGVLERYHDDGIFHYKRERFLVNILQHSLEKFPEDACETIPVLADVYAADGWRSPDETEVDNQFWTLSDDEFSNIADKGFRRKRKQIGEVFLRVCRESPRARRMINKHSDSVLMALSEGDDAPEVVKNACELTSLLRLEEGRDIIGEYTRHTNHTIRAAASYSLAALDLGSDPGSFADASDAGELIRSIVDRDEVEAIPASMELARGVEEEEYELPQHYIPELIEVLVPDEWEQLVKERPYNFATKGWERERYVAYALAISDVGFENFSELDKSSLAVRTVASSLNVFDAPDPYAIRFLQWATDTHPEKVRTGLNDVGISPNELLSIAENSEQREELGKILLGLAQTSSPIKGPIVDIDSLLQGNPEQQKLGLKICNSTLGWDDNIVKDIVHEGETDEIRNLAIRSLGNSMLVDPHPSRAKVGTLTGLAKDDESPEVRVAALDVLYDMKVSHFSTHSSLRSPDGFSTKLDSIVHDTTSAYEPENTPKVRAAAASLLCLIGGERERSKLKDIVIDPEYPEIVREATERALEESEFTPFGHIVEDSQPTSVIGKEDSISEDNLSEHPDTKKGKTSDDNTVRSQDLPYKQGYYHTYFQNLDPDAISAVHQTIDDGLWDVKEQEGFKLLTNLGEELAGIYGLSSNPPVEKGEKVTYRTDNGDPEIRLTNISIVSYLHSFRYHMHKEGIKHYDSKLADSRGWSNSLFYRAKPESFVKAWKEDKIWSMPEFDENLI